jgi:hypothetical protein
MSNLSFARIMYGTNEDHNAPHAVSATAFSTHPAQFVRQGSSIAGTERTTLGQLLRKAWTTLTGKP